VPLAIACVLRTRFWTAVVVLPVVLALILFASDVLFTCFIALITLGGLYEIGYMNASRTSAFLLIAVVGGVPALLLLWRDGRISPTWAIVVIGMMLALLAKVAYSGTHAQLRSSWLVVVGSLYVGVLVPYFALLRNHSGGVSLIILMLLLVIVSDSAAYFFGSRFGRRKLMPKVSPGKTIEGSAASLLSCLVAAIALQPMLAPAYTIDHALWLGLGINVAAQLGDLAQSAYKRLAGVKDSGWFFPGHGGLLDRTDSLVFAAVFTYYCN